jgi:hypothetical protein
MKRKRPVLVPFKLKWKDFVWFIAFSLVAIIIFLLSSSKATAQVSPFSKDKVATYQKNDSCSNQYALLY